MTTAFLGALRFSPRFTLSLGLNDLRPRGRGLGADPHRRGGQRGRPAAPRPAAVRRALLRGGRLRRRRSARSEGCRSGEGRCSARSPSIPSVAGRDGRDEVLFAIPRLPPDRLRQVLQSCEGLKLSYKILPVSFAVPERPRQRRTCSRTWLAEDLLRRGTSAVRRRGAPARSSGAGGSSSPAPAGSIGSEICRQVALPRPAQPGPRGHQRERALLLYRAAATQQHPGRRRRRRGGGHSRPDAAVPAR